MKENILSNNEYLCAEKGIYSMKNNMSVVFKAPGKADIIPVEMPSPKAGELLIKTELSQISTVTELTMLLKNVPDGSGWDKMIQYPVYPGYSNVGSVEGAGENVDLEKWLGKRIISIAQHVLYFTVNTENSRIAVIPNTISSDSAVFQSIGCIAMNGVRRGQMCWGDAAVVFGAGLIGQHVARYLRLCGAMPVFVVDISDFRLGRLPDDPCIIPINSEREEPADVVKMHTYKSRMADVVFETTGNSQLIPAEFSVLRKQGRLVVVSSPRGKTEFDFNDLCSMKSFTIIGSHANSHIPIETLDNPWTFTRDIAFHFELIQAGQYDPIPLITHHYPYTDAVKAYKMLVEDRTQALAVHLDWTVL